MDLPRDVLGVISEKLPVNDRANLRQVFPETPRVKINYRQEVNRVLSEIQVVNWSNYIDANNGFSARLKFGGGDVVDIGGYFSPTATPNDVRNNVGHCDFRIDLNEYKVELTSFTARAWKWTWKYQGRTDEVQFAPSVEQKVYMLASLLYVADKLGIYDVTTGELIDTIFILNQKEIQIESWAQFLKSSFDDLARELDDYPINSNNGGSKQRKPKNNVGTSGNNDTVKYDHRNYKIRTGPKGGKFILVGKDKKKIYI